ncbi:hypothetical protein ARMSODRAFT_1002974 [Armillaria solidipes]|uniref:Uncharacterized protein n=1 Tax=Armillaria solidipes TaxID=1076256 RepID=A0A2H3BJQ1_9AGAR|nr:hypothetical protein ARMSODRAFT_1002974 [Armillaria solidipes]
MEDSEERQLMKKEFSPKPQDQNHADTEDFDIALMSGAHGMDSERREEIVSERGWSTCEETHERPDFALRRVSSSGEQDLGYDGWNKGTRGRRREDDHGRVGNGRRVVVSQSAGCRSEEGLKEMVVIEETATRMPNPALLSFLGQLPKHKILQMPDLRFVTVA